MSDYPAPDFEPDELTELWQLFAEEGKEILDHTEQVLLALESAPDDHHQISELFRAFHTFKGSARTMGLNTTETLAHRAEDLASLARDGVTPFTQDMTDLLLAVLDKFRELLAHAAAHQQDPNPATVEPLVEQLQEMYARYNSPVPRPAQPKPPPLTPEPSSPPTPAPEIEVVITRPEEIIDPATDPGYVRIFLELAQEVLGSLHPALDALATGDSKASGQITEIIDNLRFAARQMGYERLISKLGVLIAAVNNAPEPVELQNIELSIFEQLTLIQDSAPPVTEADKHNYPDIAWQFRYWHADHVFANLSHLVEHLDALEQAGSPWPPQHAENIAKLLQAIYHSCQFYKLPAAAQLCMALKDLFARTAQSESVDRAQLIQLARNTVTRLGNATETIRAGQMPDPAPLEALGAQAGQLLYVSAADGYTPSDVLQSLNLPPEFADVLIPENIIEIEQALHNGEQFFTIEADLNHAEETGDVFFQWTQSGAVRLITSATRYRNDETIFNFLVTFDGTLAELQQMLAQFDPQQQLFQTQLCPVNAPTPQPQPAPAAAEAPTAELPAPAATEPPPTPQPQTDVPAQAVADLLEAVGRLGAAHSTISHVVNRLVADDFFEPLARYLQTRAEDRVPAWLQALQNWQEDLHQLARASAEIDNQLDQIRTQTLALRRKPAAVILTPLSALVRQITQARGMEIGLQTTGGDIELDSLVLERLAGPISQLVEFAAGQNFQADVPALVFVTLSRHTDRVTVAISSNGSGLNLPALVNRARTLGWATTKTASAAQTTNWILRPEFGPIQPSDGGAPLNLADIHRAMQTHQGRLAIHLADNGGIRFTLEIPLDTSILNGLIVRVEDLFYVVPIRAIQRIIRPEPQQISRTSAQGQQEFLRLQNQLIPVVRLLGDNSPTPPWERMLLVLEYAEQTAALPVDQLLGQRQVFVQPLPLQLAKVREISGLALLDDNRVGTILNVSYIVGGQ